MLSLFNLAFTGAVPLILGITDQHLSAPFLLAHPSLYPNRGTDSPQLTAASFWMSGLNGFMQSLLAFSICWLGFAQSDRGSDLWFVSVSLFGSLLLTALLKAALLLNCWTWIAVLGLASCYLSWFAYLLIYELLGRVFPWLRALKDLAGLGPTLLSSPLFWLIQLLIPCVCLGRDVLWKAYQRWYRPASYHIVQEIQLQELKRTSPVTNLGTGYAFSQTEGGQARILQL